MNGRMVDDRDLGRLLTAWFDADANIAEPDALLGVVLHQTRRARRVPGLLLLERWLPRSDVRPLELPRNLVPVLLVLGLIVALAAAVLFAGGQRRLPPPFGPAANGMIAYGSGGHIVVANGDGSGSRPITAGPLREVTPVFSRDGTRIAWFVLAPMSAAKPEESRMTLVVADVDGGNPRMIETGGDGVSPPSWSPDDRLAVYSEADPSGVDQLFVAAMDASRMPRRIGDLGQHSWGPGWQPNGNLVSFVGTDPIDGREQLYVIPTDGSGAPRQLTHGSWAHIEGADQWSPDGRSIVFAAGDDESTAIWIVGLDGRPERPAVPRGLSESDVVLSPDGSRVAYLEPVAGDIDRIQTFDLGGPAPRTLPGTYRTPVLNWSPDGTKVVVTDATLNPVRLVILDAGGSARPVEIPTLRVPDSTSVTETDAVSWQRTAP